MIVRSREIRLHDDIGWLEADALFRQPLRITDLTAVEQDAPQAKFRVGVIGRSSAAPIPYLVSNG